MLCRKAEHFCADRVLEVYVCEFDIYAFREGTYGRHEFSFISKMLNTIDPSRPLYDSQVDWALQIHRAYQQNMEAKIQLICFKEEKQSKLPRSWSGFSPAFQVGHSTGL